tara:strand:- start:320 stop:946 length:627 start_codon:yes stop_codon:yes gene_type:complete
MPSYSKSLFTNDSLPTNERSLITPITLSFASALQSVSTASAQELGFLTVAYIDIIHFIQANYSSKIANRQYENIPTDYSQYTSIVSTVNEMRSKTTNTSILVLLQIAEDSVRGAFNSLALYGDNLLLEIEKADLQKQVQEILAEQNVETTQSTVSTSNVSITQTFQLAAVFNYYIRIYGSPVVGEGFDPVKIAFLVYVLEENGIDPYS